MALVHPGHLRPPRRGQVAGANFKGGRCLDVIIDIERQLIKGLFQTRPLIIENRDITHVTGRFRDANAWPAQVATA
jgi:hypothetical protein